MIRFIFLVVLLSLALGNLAASDFRHRIHTTLDSGGYSAEDIEAEIHFGRELASKVLGRYPPWKNKQANLYVNKVGQTLVQYSQRQELTYRFAILDTDEVNAFATPGGYVFITRGALEQVESEAELAAILAHEIGHIEHRHYVKAVGLRASAGDLESGLTAVLLGGGAAAAVAFDEAVNAMMEVLFETGLQSHEDEFEADMTAVWLLTLAGYQPTALKSYFTRLKASEEASSKGISRTHPSFSERIEKLKLQLSENQLEELDFVTLEERLNEYLR